MNWKLSVIPLLFLILFSQLAQATLPIDVTITNELMIRNCNDLSAGNQAGDVNIFVACAGQAGTSQVYRFFVPLTGKQSCNLLATVPAPQSVAWINNSFFWVHSGMVNTQINFTDCSVADQTSPVITSNIYGMSFDLTNRWIAMADQQNNIIDEAGAEIRPSYWNTALDLSYPNNSDNNTIWKGEGLLEQYVNGVATGNSVHVFNTWGIDGVRGVDLVFVNATTTWLYIVSTGTDSTHWDLYRVNFTEGFASTPSILTPVYPLNATVSQETFNFDLTLTAGLNGTLIYYLDGVNWDNTTISTAPFSDQLISNEHAKLTVGNHNWTVVYLDGLSKTWDFDTITFTVEPFGFVGFIVFKITQLFELETQADGKLILALLLTTLFSIGTITKVKVKNPMMIFISVFLAFFIGFWWIGWIPLGVALPVLVGIGLLFGNAMMKLYTGG